MRGRNQETLRRVVRASCVDATIAAPRVVMEAGMRLHRLGTVLALALLLSGATAAALQQSSSAIAAEHRPLSPTVWATIAVSNDRAELVVLWRGSPGWYMKRGPRSEHASGNAQSFNVALEYGGTKVSMSFDRHRREATLGSRTVSLPAEANTVLVDHVDDSGVSITGFSTLRLSSMMTSTQLGSAFFESSTAAAFLQCDPQSNTTQQFADLAHVVCDQIDAH
jgi:hypothetical protein